jgi:hypothetical protein
MKNLFKINIVFLFSSITAFSQIDKPEHINIKETLNQLFIKTKVNSSGNLCFTMDSLGLRFNMRIDNIKESIISVYNKTYCIKDSIKIDDKHAFQLFLSRNKDNYWVAKLNTRSLHGDVKKYEGAIEIENDSIIDMPIEKYKLLKKEK